MITQGKNNENEINTINTEKGRADERAKEKKINLMHHISSEIKSHGIKWIDAPYVEMLYI